MKQKLPLYQRCLDTALATSDVVTISITEIRKKMDNLTKDFGYLLLIYHIRFVLLAMESIGPLIM